MSDAATKVLTIFRELVGDHAERLSGSRYLADVNSRITTALADKTSDDQNILRMDGIGFHVIDWQNEAAFLVALSLFPERFTDEEIREGVERLLLHAPQHILEAARLGGYPIENIFLEGNESQQTGPANHRPFGTSGMASADYAARAEAMPEASGCWSSGTFD